MRVVVVMVVGGREGGRIRERRKGIIVVGVGRRLCREGGWSRGRFLREIYSRERGEGRKRR